jgi:predicted dehydrogenase
MKQGVEMASRLRLGVIGLGRRWPVYRQALHALRSQVRVKAIHDPVRPRAEDEATQLGCDLAAGVIDLIEREDVDALLLIGAPWFGLWPIEQAARAGKPVLCTGSPLRDESYLGVLRETLPAGARVSLALLPALDRVREEMTALLQQRLGKPGHIRATRVTGREQPLLTQRETLALLHACASLGESAPVSIQAVSVVDAAHFAHLVLDLGAGRVAQLTLWASRGARPRCSLDVQAEHGAVRADLPGNLAWTDPAGRHTRRLPAGPAEQCLLERFIQALRQGSPLPCPFAQVSRAATWLLAARQSLAEGGKLVRLEQP